MAFITLISEDDADRRELKLAIEELGHRVAWATGLKDGLVLLREQRPQAVVVAEPASGRAAEDLLGELEREAPMLPVVVALKPRDAARAFDLLKAGALEVVAPPWTPESLKCCLSKALRFKGTAVEAVQPRPRWALAGLIAATALCVGLLIQAVREYRRFEAAKAAAMPRDWALPYSHPAGLAFDGKEFWVSDWFSQSLYRHQASDLRVVRMVHTPREVPGALAFAGDALWVASAPRSLIKHMLDSRLRVLGRVRDLAPQTVGMAYDGLYLWTCDAPAGRLYKRILDDELTVVASYDYPGSKPAALTFDGKSLWSLDSANRELLRHDLSRPEEVTLRLSLPEYRSGQWKPTGLAFDGRNFWTVAERNPQPDGPGRIFLHKFSKSRP